MKYSNFVGRVGALAVALGVGLAIATPAGIAWADTETTSDQSSAGPQGADSSTHEAPAEATHPATVSTPAQDGPSATPSTPNEQSTTTTPAGTGSSTTVEVAPGVRVSSSGGAHTSTHHGVSTAAKGNTARTTAQADEPAQSATTPRPTSSALARTATVNVTADDSAAQTVSHTTTTTAVTGTIKAAAVTPPVQPSSIQATVATVVRDLVAPIFSSLLAALQPGWTESPTAWMVLAATRREIGTTGAATTDATSLQTAAAQTVTMPVQNEPPTAHAVFSTPNPTTGAVTGQLVGSDPEGKKVTFTVSTKPTAGTLVYNATTATFTYTPTTAQRVLAGATSQAGSIAMTVTASDGTNKVPVQIAVPIGAIALAVRTDVNGGAGAGAVAATNTRAYVTNRDAGTVTVIDTLRATVVGTFAAGTAPDGVAVKPDGTRIYVSSSTNNTVTVIDTATGAVKATIAVAAPTTITTSPNGSAAYVTNYANATVTRISTSTNKVAAIVKMPTGSHPTGVAVSPDSTKVYVTAAGPTTGSTAVLVFSSSSTSTAATITQITGSATGLVVSRDNAKLFVSSDDGTVTVISTKTRAVIQSFEVDGVPTGVAVSPDGSAITVTDDTGRVMVFDASSGVMLHDVATRATSDPLSQRPAEVLSPDGTELYVTDHDAGVVHVVSLTPPNTIPTVGTPTEGAPTTSTGTIKGTVGAADADGDPLTYSVSGAPTMGKVVMNANGTFTYTPTTAARHAASAVNAPSGVTTDAFSVTVSDGRRGVVTATVQVAISPTNTAPTASKTIGSPNTTTGVVSGSIKGVDPNRDVVTYSQASGPAKGTVTLTPTGAFTYTPTAQARHAAMTPGATADAKQDVFTVAVDDGHGGVVNVAVTVKITPANSTPTGGSATVTQTDPRSGVVTGNLTAVDLDGDTLTYTAATAKKGTLVIGPGGSFTYTPTVAARAAASAANAAATTQAETIAITVTDGYGGTATFTMAAPITPYPSGNGAPGDGQVTVTSSSSAIGTVTGTVSATDPEGDLLKYTVASGPTKGVVKVDPTTGAFTYTPTVDARYTALVTSGVDTDTFSVTVSDGLGGTMVQPVSVTIVPPSATAVDQRPTNVAIHAPELLFESQAQINTALDAIQATGIDTLRMVIPWASVEPLPGWYDWSAVDRVVNSASVRGIKVLAVLNSTPLWAAVANTLPLAGMPKDNTQFAKFASLVATRYKGKVSSYEVWNEPNGIQFWQPSPSATQYTALLKAAYTSIKAADPNAVVVAAAVGAVIDFGNLAVNPVTFISQMYAAGAAGYFDALSFHPYLYNNPFSKGTLFDSPLSQANRIYNLMVANGDGNKKIWATEYGQPSSVVSEANEASYLGDFLRTWRNLSFAGPAFIHTLVDSTGSNPVEASFGLYHKDWTPKPAVATVEQVIAENHAIEAAANASAL